MRNRDVKRIIKSEFKDICEQNGFIYLTDSEIVKITTMNVLDMICFELAEFGITCRVAIQPLYLYRINPDVISLNMGARLSRFKTFLPEWWESGDIESNLKEIKSLLIQNGLPWFKKYGSPEGIIEFIKKGKSKEYGFHQFRYFGEKEYLGYSLLYTGKINEGLKILERMANDPISPHASPAWRKYIQDLTNLVNTMKQYPDQIPAILDNLITKNKKALKIPM